MSRRVKMPYSMKGDAVESVIFDWKLGLPMLINNRRLDQRVIGEIRAAFWTHGPYSWDIAKISVPGLHINNDVFLIVSNDGKRCAIANALLGRVDTAFSLEMTWRELAWRLWGHENLCFAVPERILEAAARMEDPFPSIEAKALIERYKDRPCSNS